MRAPRKTSWRKGRRNEHSPGWVGRGNNQEWRHQLEVGGRQGAGFLGPTLEHSLEAVEGNRRVQGKEGKTVRELFYIKDLSGRKPVVIHGFGGEQSSQSLKKA